MRKIYLFGFLALGLMTSCLKEEAFVVESQSFNGADSYAVFADEVETRTQLSPVEGENAYNVVWSAGDAYSVFAQENIHAKYVIKEEWVNQTSAIFRQVGGDSFAGTESWGGNDFNYVAFYPYSETTKVSKVNDDFVVTTEIPSIQMFSDNSYGQGASPMIAVSEDLMFGFKNVGSVLIMPLKGDVKITSATLFSDTNLAGAATVTAVKENNWIPTVDVTNGTNKVTISCGEGVQLSTDEATNFCFVIAPGTYTDLKIRFYTSEGIYFETIINTTYTFRRSKTVTFLERTFENTGVELQDLLLRVKTTVKGNTKRIVPSVNNLNFQEWALNLKNQPDTKNRIEKAVYFIAEKNYEGAYDILDGVPGFVKEFKEFSSTVTKSMEVSYSHTSYAKSFLEQLDTVTTAAGFANFLNQFALYYEVSGLKDTIVGAITDAANQILGNTSNSDKTPEQAFAEYKAEVKNQLNSSMGFVSGVIEAIEVVQNGIKITTRWGEIWVTEPEPSFMVGEEVNYRSYVTAVESLVADSKWNTLTTYEAIQTEISKLPTLNIDIDRLNYHESIDPSSFLTGEKFDIWQQISSNTLIRTMIESGIANLENMDLTTYFNNVANNAFLTYLFENTDLLTTLKTTLKDTIESIEENSKNDIDNANQDAKDAAIYETLKAAVDLARIEATGNVKEQIRVTNEENLTTGPWGIFKKVLYWSECYNLFVELGITDVYNTLLDLCDIVDKMLIYNQDGSIRDVHEKYEDYDKGVDYEVIELTKEI